MGICKGSRNILGTIGAVFIQSRDLKLSRKSDLTESQIMRNFNAPNLMVN
jgi:hypothetical protein